LQRRWEPAISALTTRRNQAVHGGVDEWPWPRAAPPKTLADLMRSGRNSS
jgi:hypothetical protein